MYIYEQLSVSSCKKSTSNNTGLVKFTINLWQRNDGSFICLNAWEQSCIMKLGFLKWIKYVTFVHKPCMKHFV